MSYSDLKARLEFDLQYDIPKSVETYIRDLLALIEALRQEGTS